MIAHSKNDLKNEVMVISDQSNNDSWSMKSTKDAEADLLRLPVGSNRQIAGYPCRWVRAAQLPALFCSWDLAYRCTKSGWLKPVVQGSRRTIYRLADVLKCMERIEAGEMPAVRPKKGQRS